MLFGCVVSVRVAISAGGRGRDQPAVHGIGETRADHRLPGQVAFATEGVQHEYIHARRARRCGESARLSGGFA